MKCAVHSDREAIGGCCSCGRFVCPECKVELDGQIYCNQCMEARLKTGSFPGGAGAIPAGNSSGRGIAAALPAELRGWNWGAFLLTWIWGIGNNVWISLISLCGLIPYIGWIISLVMAVILGLRGSEWAWQNKRWDSVEHFRQAQRKWMWWGVGLIILQVLLLAAVTVLVISLFMIATTAGLDKQFDWRSIPWQ